MPTLLPKSTKKSSAVAIDMHKGLKNPYSILKNSGQHLKLVFLIGLDKFSFFSELNNLKAITLDER